MRFIVIGDIMVDRTIYGEVHKISPEAPVPVITHSYITEVLGGAANVARNIEAIGHEVIMGGYIGEIAQKLFQKTSINIDSAIEVEQDNIKTRFVDIKTGYHLLRYDNETKTKLYGPLTSGPWIHLKWHQKILPYDGVIISDYHKGSLDSNVAEIIQYANEANVPIFVDTRRSNIDIFKGASWLMPNLKELNAILEEYNLIEPADIIKFLGLQGIIITMSEDGMELQMLNPKVRLRTAATNSHIVDVTGAGDTALASFAIAIAEGKKPVQALRIANKNAGIVCMKRGTATV